MRRSQEGLSLIEVLVAFSIVSIAFLALAMSQILGFRTTRDSLDAATARDLASEQMEIIRSYGYASYAERPGPPAFAGCPTASSADAPPCSGSKVKGNYTVRWEITKTSSAFRATTPPALLSVTVETDYGVEAERRTYTLASYLSCADASDLSVTSVPCPENSLLP